MIPLKLVPSLKVIVLFMVLFTFVSPAFFERKYSFKNIKADHSLKINITKVYETVVQNNMTLRFVLTMDQKFRYQIVKCEHVLLDTWKEVWSHDVDFQDDFLDWMYNVSKKSCTGYDTDAYLLELRLFPSSVATGTCFLLAEKKVNDMKLVEFDGFWTNVVESEANETSIISSKIASTFDDVINAEGINFNLAVDMSSPVVVSFGKCGYELPYYYHVKQEKVAIRKEVLKQIHQLSNIHCRRDRTEGSFDIKVFSTEYTMGVVGLTVVNEKLKFHVWLVKVGILIFSIIGMLSYLALIWACVKCVHRRIKKRITKSQNRKMTQKSSCCDRCGKRVTHHP